MPENEELDILVWRVAKVRKWLAAIAVLKTAAICLLFACIYIGGYVLIDHWLNLGIAGRFIAFFLLIGSSTFVIYKLFRLLLVQVSYTNAANFIENNYSLNQQLVAAMEYYENKDDYPYSTVLAEQLIIRTNKDSESFRFDSVVEKWRGFALGAFVFLGMCIVGLYVMNNLSFLKTYLARLMVPFASVDPVPAMRLEPLTGDIVAEPESMVVMSAAIKGRVPNTGLLVIAPVGTDSNDQKIQLRPIDESGKEPKFESSEFFPYKGQFHYRFEAGKVTTAWNNIDIRNAPEIKSIVAEVELPGDIQDDKVLKNYNEQIKNNYIELIKNSNVTLHIEATSKLSRAELIDPVGHSSSKELSDVNTFTHTFKAEFEGSFQFRLTDEKGMSSKNIPELKIAFKTDKLPQFKLICPDGDYIATNVSSVPIEFEITDDFGLNSAQFIAEFPEGEPLSLDIPVRPDSNEANFKYVFELEQYNLDVGDSIMFYTKAEDIKTAISGRQNTASSEIYFIEIRPYQQIWRLDSGGPSNIPGPTREDLMTLLEYTRAFVKKTSVIAGKTSIEINDRPKMDSIREDVDYCSGLLKRLRDDPQNEFTDAQKTVLNEVLAYYEKASSLMGQHNATEALVSEKEAYRILRKFILELEMKYSPPQSGSSVPEEKPEKVELKQNIEPPETEKERLQDDLEKAQNDIEKLQEQQEQLKTKLEKIMEEQKESGQSSQASSESGQKGTNGTSSKSNNQQSSDKQQSEGSSGQSSNSQKTSSQQSGESGSGQSASDKQNNDQQQGKESSNRNSDNQNTNSQQPGESSSDQSGSNQQSEGSSDQNGSGSQVSSQQSGDNGSEQSSNQQGEGSSDQSGSNQLNNSQQQNINSSENAGLAERANPTSDKQNSQSSSYQDSYDQQKRSIVDAQLKMLQAKQAQLQDEVEKLKLKLESMPQSSDSSMAQASNEAQKHLSEAAQSMKDFQDKMNEAHYEPQDFDKKSNRAKELMDEAANKLESADKALEKGLKSTSQNQLAQKMKETAEQLAESAAKMDENLTELEREQMKARLEAAKRLLESMSSAQKANVDRRGNNSSGGTHVITEGGQSLAENTREISRQFWSMFLELEKRQEKPVENEPSDSRFHEVENDFFENAANYKAGDN